MKFGQLIKLQRLKSHMTQQELANGICSTSYLSKIEKDHVIPKRGIQQALKQRLNIANELPKLDEKEFLQNIHAAYLAVQKIQQKDHAKIAFNSFSNIPITFKDPTNFYQTNLYLLYFALIAEEPFHIMGPLMKGLTAVEEHLSTYQKFLLAMNRMYFKFEQRNFKLALQYAFEAERYIQLANVNTIEEASVMYTQSRIYYQLYDYASSFSYAKEALEAFTLVNCDDQILKCYNLLGIINLQFGNFDDALLFLNKGFEFAHQLNKPAHYGRFLQNIGYAYARMQQSKKAIQFYRQSLEIKHDPKTQIITIHSIVKEFSKMKLDKSAVIWAKRGLSIIEKYHLHKPSRAHFYHFSIYLVIHGEGEKSLAIFDEAVPFFKLIRDDRNAQKYAAIAAKIAQKNGDYKRATEFYAIAAEASLASRNLVHWQDL